ncbi:tripartite tricarboxylate transporter substrate binding protein [Candidimonas sp. SYP-B2681]|uniref:Bug family tripartite tricarboxylate transporter substrate binding protein n=1 Tax=Candidimonas sp. SYP-B2681 TaxID=2497686 RepID=UPI001315879B|nr:tripartite tricarboxylate transporter substrate binding protein [Candidimonas sp. SYP-B2681]
MKILFKLTAVAALGLAFANAHAEPNKYPSRQVTIVVPFSPGGGTDTTTRLLAQKLSDLWGQSVVVENKSGAAGTIGAAQVARAKPDGYTLMMGNIGTQSINPSLYTLPYDPKTAFAPITQVVELPLILVVNSKSGIGSVKDLIDVAKKRPGELFFSSSGAGSSMQLAAEAFQQAADVKMTHVPFAGEGPAVTNLIGGQVNVTFGTVMGSGPFVKQGALKGLGVTSAKRYPTFADLPTISESGLEGYNSVSWVGLVAPAGTPKAIVDKVSQDVKAVLADTKFSEQLISQGGLPIGSSPEEFTKKINDDFLVYNKIIKANNIAIK